MAALDPIDHHGGAFGPLDARPLFFLAGCVPGACRARAGCVNARACDCMQVRTILRHSAANAKR